MDLPEWVSMEAWAGYIEMRKKIKKPLTERAKGMAIRKLDELRKKGYDPSMVLDQSTFMCWQGLFPIKEDHDGDRATRKTFDTIRRESTLGAIGRVGQNYLQVGGSIRRALPQGSKRDGDGNVH